jgi:Sjoegren syndrome nuclear autoantigen 1
VSYNAQHGATLQGYNNELVKCIEDLCSKRDDLHRQILLEEEEKAKLQNDIRILTERLTKLNESLARKISMRNDFDRTIGETEGAYNKILESSQSLVHVLKKEAGTLKERMAGEGTPVHTSVTSKDTKSGQILETQH